MPKASICTLARLCKTTITPTDGYSEIPGSSSIFFWQKCATWHKLTASLSFTLLLRGINIIIKSSPSMSIYLTVDLRLDKLWLMMICVHISHLWILSWFNVIMPWAYPNISWCCNCYLFKWTVKNYFIVDGIAPWNWFWVKEKSDRLPKNHCLLDLSKKHNFLTLQCTIFYRKTSKFGPNWVLLFFWQNSPKYIGSVTETHLSILQKWQKSTLKPLSIPIYHQPVRNKWEVETENIL